MKIDTSKIEKKKKNFFKKNNVSTFSYTNYYNVNAELENRKVNWFQKINETITLLTLDDLSSIS